MGKPGFLPEGAFRPKRTVVLRSRATSGPMGTGGPVTGSGALDLMRVIHATFEKRGELLMNRKNWNMLSWPVVLVGLASPWLIDCAGAKGGLSALGDATGMGKCPDLKAEALASLDFAKEFKVQADAAAKLQAGTIAAVELKDFSDKLDADLKGSCGTIAKELGATGEFKNGQEACQAAIKAIGETKGKLGAKGGVAMSVKPPTCSANMDVMADCAGKCDAKLSGGKAKVECEPGKLSGSCSGKCSGTCDMQAAAKCSGTCSGSCDAQMKGTCSGKCVGRCDGKDSKGSCSGTCDGKCEGGSITGDCRGKCGGSCKLKAEATCDGTCTGECKGEFKEPKCAGEVKPPEMSADCKARCDAQVSAKMTCTPASVGIAATGEAKAAEQLKGTLEKNMPAILQVALGMGARAEKMAANVKDAVAGVQASIETVAKTSGDPARATMIAGRITTCLGGPLQGAIDAAGSVKANVAVSMDVKASVSGSASGSAGASAGAGAGAK